MEDPCSKAVNEDDQEGEKCTSFLLLMFVGGFLGAFTYTIRGGVFCNAQTANFILSAIALANGDYNEFFYYLIPMTAYFLGAFISEAMPSYVKIHLHIRWDTLFILIEIAVIVFLGLLPENTPFRLTHVTVNLIASMQYNTFRETQHISMATTFCTNHLRQVGIAASKAFRYRNRESVQRMFFHSKMLASFVAGAWAASVLCRRLWGRAVFFTLLPLGYLLIDFLREDIRMNIGRSGRRSEEH